MRILWLSHLVPYPPEGGVCQRSYHLLRETAKEHSVTFVALYQREHQVLAEQLDEAKKHIGEFCESVRVFPMITNNQFLKYGWAVPVSLLPGQSYVMNWVKSRPYAEYLVELLKTEEFDAAHFDTIGLAQYRRFIGKIPAVMNHHNIESHMMLRRARKEKSLLKKTIFSVEGRKRARCEKQLCPTFQSNLTVSELDGKRLQAIAPGIRFDVIPNGVDTSYFVPGRHAPIPNTVIFVGSLGWYPNKEAMKWFVKDILPLLKELMPAVRVKIVGPNPSKDLLQLAQREPSLTVTGWVDDVRPHLEEACVYVCPIRDGGGTRLKLLDAMAAGKPIVATTLACEGLHMQDSVHVEIADTPQDFAAKTVALLNDEAKRKAMSLAARCLVEERYSFKKIGQNLSEVYNRVSYCHQQYSIGQVL